MKLTSNTNIDPMMPVLREGGPFHTRNQTTGFIERLEQMGTHKQARHLREQVSKKG